jgi:hypothetical protein
MWGGNPFERFLPFESNLGSSAFKLSLGANLPPPPAMLDG